MNIIEDLLEQHVPNRVNRKVKKEITELVFLYSFGEINANTFASSLKELGVDSFQFRLAVSRAGRIHQAKTFLYQAVALKDTRLAWQISKLGKADRGLRKLVNNPKINKAISKLLRKGFKPVSWPKLQQAIDEQYQEARRYAAYKVLHPTKGLNFVVSAGQTQKDELIDELMFLAVQNVYRTYPKLLRKKHLLNIMKRSINNWVINFQYKYSSGSVKAMTIEREGGTQVYRNLVQKLDLVEQDHPNLVVDSKPWKGMTLERLQKVHQGEQRTYITLLTGVYDPQFTTWLDARGWPSNDDLFDHLMQAGDIGRYCHLAGKFLGFTSETRKQLHLQLQTQVSGKLNAILA